MNNSVTATGMKISAKNESGSLIIGAQKYDTNGQKLTEPDATSVQASNLTSVELDRAEYNYTSSFAVKPCQHATDATKIVNLNTPGNWSYKTADAPTSYESSATSGTPLSSFTDYVIYYDLYITVAAGSPAMQNLKCNATIQDDTNNQAVRKGVRVLVASDSTSEEFFNAHTESGSATDAHLNGSTVLAASITNSTVVHLRVYIYLDGEDATVYTNNFTNLAEATISLSFIAENIPQA